MKKYIYILFLLAFMACEHPVAEKVENLISTSFSEPIIAKVERTPFAIYLVVDGSGSGTNIYAVPKVDTSAVTTLIQKITEHGGGRLFLNQVDANASNNPVVSFDIPAKPTAPILRAKLVGEQAYQYQKVEKEYQSKMEHFLMDSQKVNALLLNLSENKSESINEFFKSAYKKRNRKEDFSDVIGLLNSANRSLAVLPSNYKKVILAISDLENDVKGTPKDLSPMPKNIELIRVNASDSGSPVSQSTEIDTFENALSYIFNDKI